LLSPTGILTQPCHDCPGQSYIASSYVKWVEAAGGRVAPIRFYASDAERGARCG